MIYIKEILIENYINSLKIDDLKNYAKNNNIYLNEKDAIVILDMAKNNASIYLNENLETTKKNKNAHGYGLKNVKEIVEKYQGNLQIKKTEGKFIVSIILKEDAS